MTGDPASLRVNVRDQVSPACGVPVRSIAAEVYRPAVPLVVWDPSEKACSSSTWTENPLLLSFVMTRRLFSTENA